MPGTRYPVPSGRRTTWAVAVPSLETTVHESSQRRKRPEFDPSGRVLVMNGQPLADNKYQEP